MIENDEELRATQERIAYFENLMLQFRRTARPEEFLSVTKGYRLEIEKMQREVRDSLTRPVNLPARAA